MHLLLCSIVLLCLRGAAASDCAAYDSCTADTALRTCECEPSCAERGTCCADAVAEAEGPPSMLCRQGGVATPVFAKRRCAPQYDGHGRNRVLCENALDDPADVLVNAPYTSPDTLVTYWNKFCAVCNGEDEKGVNQWIIMAMCPGRHEKVRITKSQVHKNLTFDRDTGTWGLEMAEGFLNCSVHYVQPYGFSGKLDYCLPNIVSECPEETDSDTTSKCTSGPRAERRHKVSGQYFKNADCALCHGVTPEHLECVGRVYGPVRVIPDTGDLVRVFFDSGRWVTREVSVCSHGNSYDPFSNACRKTPPVPKGEFWTKSGAAGLLTSLIVVVLSLLVVM